MPSAGGRHGHHLESARRNAMPPLVARKRPVRRRRERLACNTGPPTKISAQTTTSTIALAGEASVHVLWKSDPQTSYVGGISKLLCAIRFSCASPFTSTEGLRFLGRHERRSQPSRSEWDGATTPLCHTSTLIVSKALNSMIFIAFFYCRAPAKWPSRSAASAVFLQVLVSAFESGSVARRGMAGARDSRAFGVSRLDDPASFP